MHAYEAGVRTLSGDVLADRIRDVFCFEPGVGDETAWLEFAEELVF